MIRYLQILALLAAFGLPAFCQNAGLPPDEQREFDKAYSKWVNDTRKNDRDDIARDVRKMQDIMARNNIAANVPYDQVASSGQGYQDRPYQSQLSPEDQRDFDRIYTKWVNDTRKNDRDDIDRDVRKMDEIKARYNIPADTPYDQIASTGQSYLGNQPPYPSNEQVRLSPEDQRDFDRYYSQWLDDSRRRDRDDANRDMQHMQDIMARYNIPSNVPPGQVATPGTYPRANYNNGYPNNAYPNNAYPNNAYPNSAYSSSRLSPDDQHKFDEAYAKWLDDTRRNDRDDIDKDARKMQDIMARYNIPSDVPYDQIASTGASYRH